MSCPSQEFASHLSKHKCSLLTAKNRQFFCLILDPSGSIQVGGMSGEMERLKARKESVHLVPQGPSFSTLLVGSALSLLHLL